MVKWIVLAIMLAPVTAGAFCTPPVCQDILTQSCQAQERAYQNCKRLEEMQEQQRQQQMYQDQINREKYRRDW